MKVEYDAQMSKKVMQKMNQDLIRYQEEREKIYEFIKSGYRNMKFTYESMDAETNVRSARKCINEFIKKENLPIEIHQDGRSLWIFKKESQ